MTQQPNSTRIRILAERAADAADGFSSAPMLSATVTVFNEIDSTNSYARRLLAEGKNLHRCVFIADRQTSGRGRMGRPFHSPAGCG
jgi:hypothetical protein